MKDYAVGSVVFNNWVISGVLGQGSFGKVFEIRRADGFTDDISALKVLTVPGDQSEVQQVMATGMTQEQARKYFYGVVEQIVNEIKIMTKLKATANVVSVEDHQILPHQDGLGWDILIRMELLHPLMERATSAPMSRRDIIRLGIDMCRALELCQRNNIIHRDIKPENIFYSDNGDYKLGDFGIARTVERTGSNLTKTGTYTYMAPEVFRGEAYGFSVDIYSLGVVMYRLLNKNRAPFMPMPPAAISAGDQETALTRRMSREPLPPPFYNQGRLPEIVLKACAPLPADRYSSPMQMRQELEAIQYEADDAAQIYPDGDTLEMLRSYYAKKKAQREESLSQVKRQLANAAATASDPGASPARPVQPGPRTPPAQPPYNGGQPGPYQPPAPGPQQVRYTPPPPAPAPAPKKKSHKGVWIGLAVCLAVVLIAGGAGLYYVKTQQDAAKKAEQEKLEDYEDLMQEGTDLLYTDPEAAMKCFKEAQELFPEETAPFTSYAAAMYNLGDYQACVDYIENDLAMGKGMEIEAEGKLCEILGAAYFELDDYAAAASAFRMSTAGGDITVSAMRDYAVSLGRLGDVERAGEILAQMREAGAEDDVTAYVQAEVDYALENYLEAESGFQGVLDTTADQVLQKRALRSLAEVYRDCSGLERTGSSPISGAAVKEVDLLANGINQFGLRSDSTLWEMLGMAYFESYHVDPGVPQDYLQRAADCFDRVIELGVTKDYLYVNLYTIYYEMANYDKAEEALQSFESVYPNAYMPHALRGMMLITIENAKPEDQRNYRIANDEYELAGTLLKSSDDATYYQQLGTLIDQLYENGWLD